MIENKHQWIWWTYKYNDVTRNRLVHFWYFLPCLILWKSIKARFNLFFSKDNTAAIRQTTGMTTRIHCSFTIISSRLQLKKLKMVNTTRNKKQIWQCETEISNTDSKIKHETINNNVIYTDIYNNICGLISITYHWKIKYLQW